MLEIDFTLGPLRLRFSLSTPEAATDGGVYLAEVELAEEADSIEVGFRG
jgi:hypothetical protein